MVSTLRRNNDLTIWSAYHDQEDTRPGQPSSSIPASNAKEGGRSRE
jgi:hypothetical protein